MPNRASRTGAFLSKGAVWKWLSCRGQDAQLRSCFLCLLSVQAHMNGLSIQQRWRSTDHPVSSWEKLFEVVKAWWGGRNTDLTADQPTVGTNTFSEATMCYASGLGLTASFKFVVLSYKVTLNIYLLDGLSLSRHLECGSPFTFVQPLHLIKTFPSPF